MPVLIRQPPVGHSGVAEEPHDGPGYDRAGNLFADGQLDRLRGESSGGEEHAAPGREEPGGHAFKLDAKTRRR